MSELGNVLYFCLNNYILKNDNQLHNAGAGYFSVHQLKESQSDG